MNKEEIFNKENSSIIPLKVKILGEWSKQILIISAAFAIIFLSLSKLTIIVIPILIALLLSALLSSLVDRLVVFKVPKWLSVFLVLLGSFSLIISMFSLIGKQFYEGYPQLKNKTFEGFEKLHNMFVKHVNFPNDDLNNYTNHAINEMKSYSGAIANTTLDFGTTLGNFIAGLILTFFILIFFLFDGQKIWKWCISLLPSNISPYVDMASKTGWSALVGYVRIQLLVAFFDGLGIAIITYFLKVPFAIPIGILVFLGAFIPIIGSLLTGMIAVLVALVIQGLMSAFLMLLGVILVQQIESHILQPFLVGGSLSLHPLAIVLAVTASGYLAGISGALFSVPLLAAINGMTRAFYSNKV